MDRNFKFYGQFEYKLDNYLYDKFFEHKFNGISIEAGVSDGVTENTTKFFEETMNWKTYNIEPLPAWYDKLVLNRTRQCEYQQSLAPVNRRVRS